MSYVHLESKGLTRHHLSANCATKERSSSDQDSTRISVEDPVFGGGTIQSDLSTTQRMKSEGPNNNIAWNWRTA